MLPRATAGAQWLNWPLLGFPGPGQPKLSLLMFELLSRVRLCEPTDCSPPQSFPTFFKGITEGKRQAQHLATVWLQT